MTEVEYLYHYQDTPYCSACQRPHAFEPSVGTLCCRCAKVEPSWDFRNPDVHTVDLAPYQYLIPPPNPMLSGKALCLYTTLKIGWCSPGHFEAIVAPEVAKVPEPRGSWVGAIGDRPTLTLRCDKVVELGLGDHGLQFLAIMTDDAGRLFVWKTGENLWMNEGETYTIKGTIKAHNTYYGTRQTRLSRCSTKGIK